MAKNLPCSDCFAPQNQNVKKASRGMCFVSLLNCKIYFTKCIKEERYGTNAFMIKYVSKFSDLQFCRKFEI